MKAIVVSRALLKSLSAKDYSFAGHAATLLCARLPQRMNPCRRCAHAGAHPLRSASNRKSAAARGIMLCQTMSYTLLSMGSTPAGTHPKLHSGQ